MSVRRNQFSRTAIQTCSSIYLQPLMVVSSSDRKHVFESATPDIHNTIPTKRELCCPAGDPSTTGRVTFRTRQQQTCSFVGIGGNGVCASLSNRLTGPNNRQENFHRARVLLPQGRFGLQHFLDTRKYQRDLPRKLSRNISVSKTWSYG